MSESKEDDINNTSVEHCPLVKDLSHIVKPIVYSWDDKNPLNTSWDDYIPNGDDEELNLSPAYIYKAPTDVEDEGLPYSFRYESDVQIINLKQFTSKTREFINNVFTEEQNVNPDDFSHIYENLSHDGYDLDGPCSNLIDLFITIYRSDGNYYYFFYQAEEWFTPNEVVEYTLKDSFTSNRYDPIIYNQNDWCRVRDE